LRYKGFKAYYHKLVLKSKLTKPDRSW
jgi:hypothetical protein